MNILEDILFINSDNLNEINIDSIFENKLKIDDSINFDYSLTININNLINLDEYYVIGSKISKDDYNVSEVINGVIISVNNTNYFLTTYVPNANLSKDFSITYGPSNQQLEITNIINQYMFNLSAFEIKNFRESSTIYKYNLNTITNNIISNRKSDSAYILLENNLNNAVEIPLNLFSYEFIKNKHPKLPNILVIKISLKNDIDIDINISDIYPGNAIIRKYQNKNKLLGIISSIELTEDGCDIMLISSYTILFFLRFIKGNKLTNLWFDIDIDNNIITNIYKNSLPFLIDKNNIELGDQLLTIDDKIIINGCIYDEITNIFIPLHTYIWYNQYLGKGNIKSQTSSDAKEAYNILIKKKDQSIVSINYPYINIDNIMTVGFNHIPGAFNLSDKSFIFQYISFELIDYLLDKSIFLEGDLINKLFDTPFDEKDNDIIISKFDSKSLSIIYSNIYNLINRTNDNMVSTKILFLDKVCNEDIRSLSDIAKYFYKNENISRLIKSYGIVVKESKPVTARIDNDKINFEIII